MPIGRVETIWSVPGGGDGMSVMHVNVPGGTMTSADGTAVMAAVRAFWYAINGRLPNDVTLTFPGPIDLLSDSGTLTGSVVPGTAPSSVPCGGSGVWANAIGAKVTWETGTIAGGKRIRGRTYIVPLAGDQYDADGTLNSATVTALVTEGNNLIDALDTAGFPLAVWSRKLDQVFLVNGVTADDKTAILRARRDG